MSTRLICCIILVMLSQPLFAQRRIPSRSYAGRRAVTAFVSDDQVPSGAVDAGSEVIVTPEPDPSFVGEPGQIGPATDYFGPVVGGRVGAHGRLPLFATVDAIFLDRDNGSYNRPLVVDVNSGDTRLSTDSLDFDYEPGVRATIGLVRPPCFWCTAWEFTYLGVFDWDTSATVVGDDNLAVAGDLGFVVNGFTLAESIRTEYGSNIHSGEANCITCLVKHCCCCCYKRVDLITGVRYLKLDEDLTLRGNNENVAAAVYNVDTDNNLYGAQIGSRIRAFRPMKKHCGYWGWELLGKVGPYGVDSSQRQQIVDELGVNDVVLRRSSGSSDDVAFVGELGLSALARLNPTCGLRCGYNLLWVEGVALAADQLDFTDTANSGTYLRDGAGSFLHGFNVGLEVGW